MTHQNDLVLIIHFSNVETFKKKYSKFRRSILK